MTPKHQALVEENRDLLAENDALRTEIIKLKRPANYAHGSMTTSESAKKMPSISADCGRITKECMPN